MLNPKKYTTFVGKKLSQCPFIELLALMFALIDKKKRRKRSEKFKRPTVVCFKRLCISRGQKLQQFSGICLKVVKFR